MQIRIKILKSDDRRRKHTISPDLGRRPFHLGMACGRPTYAAFVPVMSCGFPEHGRQRLPELHSPEYKPKKLN